MSALPHAEDPGLVGSLGRLSRSLLAHLRMRLQLIGLELEEEKQRLFFGLVATLATALFFSLTLIAVAMVVIVHYWDTPYREQATWGVALACALLTIIAGAIAANRLMRPSQLFHASLAELVDDEKAFLHDAMRESGLEGDHAGP